MNTIYFYISEEKIPGDINDFESIITFNTSYSNDGYLSDDYSEEDIIRLNNICEKHGFSELQTSIFECPERYSKQQIIDILLQEGLIYLPEYDEE